MYLLLCDKTLLQVFLNRCGGVFDQLARYTTRYQESDLHLSLSSS